jgi:F-type H+-transporting ATPase subunit a
MKFFPFVFSLFMFIMVANLIGLIPYSFAVTAQIIITAALANRQILETWIWFSQGLRADRSSDLPTAPSQRH